ncbi:unnamed protein product [Brassica oleracea]
MRLTVFFVWLLCFIFLFFRSFDVRNVKFVMNLRNIIYFFHFCGYY